MSDGGSAQRSAGMTISKHKTDSGHREFHAVARSGAAASYQARIKAQVWRAAEESGMGLAACGQSFHVRRGRVGGNA